MTRSIEDRIAAAVDRPRTIEVEVCRSGGLVNLHAELVSELGAVVDEANASKSIADDTDPRIDEIASQIEQVEAAMAEHTVVYEMQPVSALAWNDLLRDHPPRRGIDTRSAFNVETFPPACVAACIASPETSADEVAELYQSLPSGEWTKLFEAAWVLNEGETPRPKLPAAIGSLLASVRSSTTAANGE